MFVNSQFFQAKLVFELIHVLEYVSNPDLVSLQNSIHDYRVTLVLHDLRCDHIKQHVFLIVNEPVFEQLIHAYASNVHYFNKVLNLLDNFEHELMRLLWCSRLRLFDYRSVKSEESLIEEGYQLA